MEDWKGLKTKYVFRVFNNLRIKKQFIYGLVIIIGFVLAYIICYRNKSQIFTSFLENQERNNTNIRVSAQNESSLIQYANTKQKEQISIVFYYPFYSVFKKDITKLQMSKCKYSNCKVSYTMDMTIDAIEADAILIQGQRALPILPPYRNNNQIFVFTNIECPLYLNLVNLRESHWHHYYNWTMTYRLDSDVPYPYGAIRKLDGIGETFSRVVDKNYSAIYQRKSRNAAWLVSHCKTKSKREDYISRMKSGIDIDVFGNCYDLKCPRHMDKECKHLIVQNYKFYLAFENSLCIDYITEKVYGWYQQDIALVVRGALNHWAYLPKGTYIDTNDFKSPEMLSKFLTELAADEARYTEMLRAKDKYEVVGPNETAQIAYCELCRKLNNVGSYTKVIPDIYSWWEKDYCKLPDDM